MPARHTDRPDRIRHIERTLRRIALVATPDAATHFVERLSFEDLFEIYQHTALAPHKPGHELFNLAVRRHMNQRRASAQFGQQDLPTD
jgi:hypothetical protein